MVDAKPPRGWYHSFRIHLADMTKGHALPDFLQLSDHCVEDAPLSLTAALESDIKARPQLSPKAYLATTQVVYDKKGNMSFQLLTFDSLTCACTGNLAGACSLSSYFRTLTCPWRPYREYVLRSIGSDVCVGYASRVESLEHLPLECRGPYPSAYDDRRFATLVGEKTGGPCRPSTGHSDG